MTKERLALIKAEMIENSAAFQKDGYQYFIEFLPIIEKAISEKTEYIAPLIEKKEEPKVVRVFPPDQVDYVPVHKKKEEKVEKKEHKLDIKKVFKKK